MVPLPMCNTTPAPRPRQVAAVPNVSSCYAIGVGDAGVVSMANATPVVDAQGNVTGAAVRMPPLAAGAYRVCYNFRSSGWQQV